MTHDRNFKRLILDSAQNGLAELEPDPERRLKYAGFIDAHTNLRTTGQNLIRAVSGEIDLATG